MLIYSIVGKKIFDRFLLDTEILTRDLPLAELLVFQLS